MADREIETMSIEEDTSRETIKKLYVSENLFKISLEARDYNTALKFLDVIKESSTEKYVALQKKFEDLKRKNNESILKSDISTYPLYIEDSYYRSSMNTVNLIYNSEFAFSAYVVCVGFTWLLLAAFVVVPV